MRHPLAPRSAPTSVPAPRPSPRTSLLPCVALAALALLASTTSPAQAPRPATPSRRQPSTPASVSPSTRQLPALEQAQQQALSSGDPVAIASSTRTLLAHLLRSLAEIRLGRGSADEAGDIYRKSLALEDTPETHLELASVLLRSSHPRQAAEEAALATAVDPRSASAWTIRGTALRASGNEPGAADAFTRSLEIHPDANVAYALASALLASHQKQQADHVLRQIIAASGNAPIWHIAAGDAYREARYFDHAVQQFKAAIALDPRAPHAEFFLGLTFLQMNQWGPNSESFRHLREAVRLNPHDYVSNFYLGALESTDGSDLPSSNRHLLAASAADPSSPEVWLYLGLNANRARDSAAARRYLQKAIDLTGSDESRNNFQVRRAYFALGRLLIAEGNRAEGEALLAKYKHAEQAAVAESSASIGQVMGSADDASHTLSSLSSSPVPTSARPAAAPPPPAPDTHLTTAQRQQLDSTEAELRQLLASGYNDLGAAEARQQQYPVALTHFQEAEHWASPSPALLRNLGIAAFRSEDFAEAARALGLYLHPSGHPSPPSADASSDQRTELIYALSLFSVGDFPSAARAFSLASELALQDPRAAYSWAFSLAHSGGNTRANQIATDLAARPLPPDVLSLVCHLFLDTEDFESSIGCYRKAYAADPSLKLAHFHVAESLIRLDRPADAIPELKQELALSPDDPNVQYSLAFALLQTSHKPEAQAMLSSIAAAHPDHSPAQYQLGKLLLEAGDIPGAIQHLQLAEQADPKPDYIHYQLAAAYRKSGRIPDADRELAIYRDIKARNRDSNATPHNP